jgi:ATP-dependent helicase IRC3
MVKFSVSLLNLRHYQLECIDKSIEAFKAGLKRICVSLPVGSGISRFNTGKTVTFANLIPRIPGSNTRYKVLILAHRKELLKQAHDVIKKYCPDLKIGVDIGRKSPDPDAQVIIARY